MTEASIRGKGGMVSVKDMPLLQDGPPPGGFPPVRYARRIPNKGPSAAAVFLVSFGVISWGMYQIGKGNKHRRESQFANKKILESCSERGGQSTDEQSQEQLEKCMFSRGLQAGIIALECTCGFGIV